MRISLMKVYTLKSEVDGSFYVGMSDNTFRRLKEHNSGKVKSTKSKKPWKIIHTEEFDSRTEARNREKYLKSAAGRRYRKQVLGH